MPGAAVALQKVPGTMKRLLLVIALALTAGSFVYADTVQTADLADQFGIVFLNGFAMRSFDEGGTMSFTRSSGSLADHAITRGRTDSEQIESLRSFTGQALAKQRCLRHSRPFAMASSVEWA